jgi:predicted NUDIX family NTP pyrophosphohydrolase
MRSRVSAGLLLYQVRDGQVEVYLAHPGGPFFTRKDAGHWTIPKGEVEPGEDFLATARREFQEEIGLAVDPRGPFIELGSIRQKGGKTVHAWGLERQSLEPIVCQSNCFRAEWPPGSGTWRNFPEVDRAQFYDLATARQYIKDTQVPFLDRLAAALKEQGRL